MHSFYYQYYFHGICFGVAACERISADKKKFGQVNFDRFCGSDRYYRCVVMMLHLMNMCNLQFV